MYSPYARRATKISKGCWRYRGYVILRSEHDWLKSVVRWEVAEGEGEYSGNWCIGGHPMFKQLGDARKYIDRIIREGKVAERV